MNKRHVTMVSRFILFGLLLFGITTAAHGAPSEDKAVVLAVFGTSHESALPGILNIQEQVQKSMPGIPVRLAFTSNIIRRIWQKRNLDNEYIKNHPEVPPAILNVKGPLATMADLQDEGYGYIIVQPTHISSSEEYSDLCSYVNAMNSIRTVKERNMPLRKVLVGRPALGTHGIKHEYRHDIEKVAEVMAVDVERAQREGRDLVYFGHGNEHYSTGAYMEFEQVMRKRYPQVKTYVTMVEGFPGTDYLLERLETEGSKKVLIKPFMTVAGDHAKNDMAGDDTGSLKNILMAHGYDVDVVLVGLGENDAFAAIFAHHAQDALSDAGLSL